jgi:hypothetical protein
VGDLAACWTGTHVIVQLIGPHDADYITGNTGVDEGSIHVYSELTVALQLAFSLDIYLA